MALTGRDNVLESKGDADIPSYCECAPDVRGRWDGDAHALDLNVAACRRDPAVLQLGAIPGQRSTAAMICRSDVPLDSQS